MNRYTRKQTDILLNLFFRDHRKPTPYPDIAKALGIDCHKGLDDLLWKTVTGYPGNTAIGPRKVYEATLCREDRTGQPWYEREDLALDKALKGEGQERDPVCDMDYLAAVLARPVAEIKARWGVLHPEGFGVAHTAHAEVKWAVVDTDNFGGDYPNESFVGGTETGVSGDVAKAVAAKHNDRMCDTSPRYHNVVKLPYKLVPGFTP